MDDTAKRIQELEAETLQARKSGDLTELVPKLGQLGEVYADAGDACRNTWSFDSAAQLYAQAVSTYTEARETVQTIITKMKEGLPGEDPADEGKALETLTAIVTELDRDVVKATCFRDFSDGMCHKLSRSPGEAALRFVAARDGFRRLHQLTKEGLYKFLGDYSAVLEPTCQGLELMMRSNDAGARIVLQRAKTQMATLVEELTADELGLSAEEFELVKAPLNADVVGIEMQFLFADARDQFSRGNYQLAAKQYARLCDTYRTKMEPGLGNLTDVQRCVSLTDFYVYSGFRYLAQGESFREEHRWDEALGSYEKAREELASGADSILKTGIPQAAMMQETLANQNAALEFYARAAERERRLYERVVELESSLKELQTTYARAGVTVQNFTEMKTTVEQHLQFIQKTESSAREAISEIADKVDETGLSDSQKDVIKKKAHEVLEAEEKGASFLERAKRFSGDVAEIVGNAARIAEPIAPFVKLLSLLH